MFLLGTIFCCGDTRYFVPHAYDSVACNECEPIAHYGNNSLEGLRLKDSLGVGVDRILPYLASNRHIPGRGSQRSNMAGRPLSSDLKRTSLFAHLGVLYASRKRELAKERFRDSRLFGFIRCSPLWLTRRNDESFCIKARRYTL